MLKSHSNKLWANVFLISLILVISSNSMRSINPRQYATFVRAENEDSGALAFFDDSSSLDSLRPGTKNLCRSLSRWVSTIVAPNRTATLSELAISS